MIYFYFGKKKTQSILEGDLSNKQNCLSLELHMYTGWQANDRELLA